MPAAMQITSPAFAPGQAIPLRYTCDGEDISPELRLNNLPSETAVLAIIMDDPDAPSGTFDHWLAWNISPKDKLPEGTILQLQGRNGFGELGYRGPCPPRGKPHRYFFKIFALDEQLSLPSGSSKKDLEHAMEGHILAEGTLMGTYQRK